MKQKVKLVFIVLVAAIFLIGCTQKQENVKSNEQTGEEVQGGQIAPEELDDGLDGALQDLDDIEEE